MLRSGLSTDVSCKLCTVLSESFCIQSSVTSQQKGFRQKRTQLADQTRAEHYILLYSLFHTIKAPNGKLADFLRFFHPSYTDLERTSNDFLFRAGALLMKFLYHVQAHVFISSIYHT